MRAHISLRKYNALRFQYPETNPPLTTPSSYLSGLGHHSRGQQFWKASFSMEDTWLPVGGLVMNMGVAKRKMKKARAMKPTVM